MISFYVTTYQLIFLIVFLRIQAGWNLTRGLLQSSILRRSATTILGAAASWSSCFAWLGYYHRHVCAKTSSTITNRGWLWCPPTTSTVANGKFQLLNDCLMVGSTMFLTPPNSTMGGVYYRTFLCSKLRVITICYRLGTSYISILGLPTYIECKK